MGATTNFQLRTVDAVRYILPLREGGSMPALVDGDDEFQYVLKFKGAGQGVKALIAELLGGEIAKSLGLKIPELVFINVDPAFGRTEPDAEIQDLLKASAGLNLGLHFLKGAMNFDPLGTPVSGIEASQIVWLDAYLMNVDRTYKNTNLLVWHKELWLIDHGASLYFHHNISNWKAQIDKPFINIKDHVLLKRADQLSEVNEIFSSILTDDMISNIVDLIPAEWLSWAEQEQLTVEGVREIYRTFLIERKHHSDTFIKQAIDARKTLI